MPPSLLTSLNPYRPNIRDLYECVGQHPRLVLGVTTGALAAVYYAIGQRRKSFKMPPGPRYVCVCVGGGYGVKGASVCVCVRERERERARECECMCIVCLFAQCM